MNDPLLQPFLCAQDINLADLESQVSGGCSATLALILDDSRLFVSNVGDCQAILCNLQVMMM